MADLILKRGRHVEWHVAKTYEGGQFELWEEYPTQRAADDDLERTYNDGHFCVVKLTIERLVPKKRAKARKRT